VPPQLEHDCTATLSAIERVLTATESAYGWQWRQSGGTALHSIYAFLAALFILPVLGTVRILFREVRTHRPSPYPVVALVLVWGAGLGLRLWMSPHTFLHE